MSKSTIEQITAMVAEKFPTFGGGQTKGAEFNPLVTWTKGKPLMFAMGVDVQSVVCFVLNCARESRNR